MYIRSCIQKSLRIFDKKDISISHPIILMTLRADEITSS